MANAKKDKIEEPVTELETVKEVELIENGDESVNEVEKAEEVVAESVNEVEKAEEVVAEPAVEAVEPVAESVAGNDEPAVEEVKEPVKIVEDAELFLLLSRPSWNEAFAASGHLTVTEAKAKQWVGEDPNRKYIRCSILNEVRVR